MPNTDIDRMTITQARAAAAEILDATDGDLTGPDAERFAAITVPKRAMPWGGLLSGFFGGLSGHQGALRSIFLVKSGTDPKRFAGTSATIAAMVDIARLAIYAAGANGKCP